MKNLFPRLKELLNFLRKDNFLCYCLGVSYTPFLHLLLMSLTESISKERKSEILIPRILYWPEDNSI